MVSKVVYQSTYRGFAILFFVIIITVQIQHSPTSFTFYDAQASSACSALILPGMQIGSHKKSLCL